MQPLSHLFHKGRGMKDLEGALKHWLTSQPAAKSVMGKLFRSVPKKKKEKILAGHNDLL